MNYCNNLDSSHDENEDELLDFVSALACSSFDDHFVNNKSECQQGASSCSTENFYVSTSFNNEQREDVGETNNMASRNVTTDDVEQLKHALNEKDKDLQLAARIGKCLLERNQQLQSLNDHLECQISSVNDQLVQLKHELQQKMDLLKRWTQENQSLDSYPSSPGSNSSTPSSEKKLYTLNVLERKLANLEDENASLKLEVNHLKYLAESLHDKEQQLAKDFAKQTNTLNIQLKELSDGLAQSQDSLAAKEEQLELSRKDLLDKTFYNKRLTAENEELTLNLLAAQETQRELAQELSDLRDRYAEISAMLTESRLELKKSEVDYRRGSNLGLYSPGFLGDSLASELDEAINNQSDHGYESFLSPSPSRKRTVHLTPTVTAAPPKLDDSQSDDTSNLVVNASGTSIISTSNENTTQNLCKFGAQNSNNRLGLYGNINKTIGNQFAINSLQDTELIFVTEHLILKNRYYQQKPTIALENENRIQQQQSSIGVPGVPGSRDLDNALRRLSLRKQIETEYQNFRRERRKSSISVENLSSEPKNCDSASHNFKSQTNLALCQDSGSNTVPCYLATISNGNADLSGLTTVSMSLLKLDNSAQNSETRINKQQQHSNGASKMRYANFSSPVPKLLLVKPMQGSETLAHWRELATPTFNAQIDPLTSASGVQMKTAFPLRALHDRYQSGGIDSGINSDVESTTSNTRVPQIWAQNDNTFHHQKEQIIAGALTLTFVTSQIACPPGGLYTEAQSQTYSTTTGQITSSLSSGVYTKWPTRMTVIHQSIKNPICSTGLLEIVNNPMLEIQTQTALKKQNKNRGLFNLLGNPDTKKPGVLSRSNVN